MNGILQNQQPRRWMLAALSFGVLLACPEAAWAKDPKVAPATIEKIEGSAISRVTLIGSANNRLGIQTAPVREEMIAPRGTTAPAELRKVVSYSAVIYDTTGAAWIYTNPKPLAFIREPISIEYSAGDMTVLVSGPPIGTQVVVVGAAELYGAETGVK